MREKAHELFERLNAPSSHVVVTTPFADFRTRHPSPSRSSLYMGSFPRSRGSHAGQHLDTALFRRVPFFGSMASTIVGTYSPGIKAMKRTLLALIFSSCSLVMVQPLSWGQTTFGVIRSTIRD